MSQGWEIDSSLSSSTTNNLTPSPVGSAFSSNGDETKSQITQGSSPDQQKHMSEADTALIRKTIQTIQTELERYSHHDSILNAGVVQGLSRFIGSQDHTFSNLQKSERLIFLKNFESLLRQIKHIEEAREDEVESLKSSFQEKLGVLEAEIQRKDTMISVLMKLNEDKDKLIDSIHMEKAARVNTPSEMKQLKQELYDLKKLLPETSETLTLLKKEKKKASTPEAVGKRVTLSYSKELNDLKEYVVNNNKQKPSQNVPKFSILNKENISRVDTLERFDSSLERLPRINRRHKK